MDGETNDIPSHTTPQSCGYQSDDLTFNFTVGRFRRMSRRSADVLVAELLHPGHEGRGKQRARLIGPNQTFGVRYNHSRRRGIRAPRLQLMRARVQAHRRGRYFLPVLNLRTSPSAGNLAAARPRAPRGRAASLSGVFWSQRLITGDLLPASAELWFANRAGGWGVECDWEE